MTMKSLETILPKIVKATEEGRLDWKETFGGAGYQAAMSNATTLRIANYQDQDTGDEGLRLDLRPNSAPVALNKELDYYSAMDGSAGYVTLNRLMRGARRSANNVDQVIREIEAELDEHGL